MQEAAAADEPLAWVLAVDDVVDGAEIGLAIAFAALRRPVLPRGVLRILHALRRCRVRGQEVLRARIERGGLSCLTADIRDTFSVLVNQEEQSRVVEAVARTVVDPAKV